MDDCDEEVNRFAAEETPVFLTEQYVETYEVMPTASETSRETLYPAQTNDLSLSRPSVDRGEHVKGKEQARPVPVPVKQKRPPVLEQNALKTEKEMAVSAPVESARPVQSVSEKSLIETKTVSTTITKEPDVTTTITPNPAVETTAVSTTVATVPVSTTKTTTTKTVTKKKSSAKTGLEARIEYGEAVHDWSAPSGETLRSLLMQWGEKAGWTVAWKLDRDYRLEAGVVFRGTFTDVAAALIRSFARATPAPIGEFFTGNRALVVRTQEDENAN